VIGRASSRSAAATRLSADEREALPSPDVVTDEG
jgi:hypothetical protein